MSILNKLYKHSYTTKGKGIGTYDIYYSCNHDMYPLLFVLTENTFLSKERDTIFVFYHPLSCKITFFMNFQRTIGNGKDIKIT